MIEWLKRTLGSRRLAADAFAAHDSGDWAKAAPLLQRLAAERPGDVAVAYRLGDALYQLERAREALPLLERAATADARNAEYQYKLGNALKDLERNDEALERYRRALQLDPGHARALNNAGTILELQNRLEEALDHYRQATRVDGRLQPARANLAVLLHRLERFEEAAQVYEALLQSQPDSVRDWCSLGNAYQGMGRYDEAVRCYERALKLDPASADAHYRSGVALMNLEKYPEAEAAARRAAEMAPAQAEGWANLGDTLQAQHRYDDALAAYERGLGLNSEMPELLNNIGAAYKHKGDVEKAIGYFERAVAISPRYVLAHVNLATARYTLGKIDEAVAGFRAVLEIDPQNVHAARHLLMALLYVPGATGLFAEHRAFARRFALKDKAVPARTGPLDPGRKLRIGYVSSDLASHPVGYNLLPLIQQRDGSAFEVYLYSNVRHPDHVTRWFRERADAWRSITLLSDEEAAQKIREDRIDILVLLAGRFDDNRPLIATYRPAPIQVSMHDPATSGLDEVDYLIADRGLSPRRTREEFTERVTCLPTFYVHPPLADAPLFPTPPAARNGWITFGSFNNPAKINDSVVALWARVLEQVPGSKLLLKYQGVFSIPGVRARYLELFRRCGIGEDRLILPGQHAENRKEHLSRYEQIDVALDTFPFTGSTTTFEALWMGIPVVTLEGESMVARWSTAMLRKVGLSRLIARTEAEYVEIARTLAADAAERARLRETLRERVARSPLCAEKGRARQMERLYRRMWTLHCARAKKT